MSSPHKSYKLAGGFWQTTETVVAGVQRLQCLKTAIAEKEGMGASAMHILV
jgi:hypothetical protein